MTTSAGTLLYRKSPKGVEVLIVHPSGEYNINAPWSIPKGLVELGESEIDAARRETKEECGVTPPDNLVLLGEVTYKKGKSKGKRVVCFAGEIPLEVTASCASWEIDKAEFIDTDTAEKMLSKNQQPFIGMLKKVLT